GLVVLGCQAVVALVRVGHRDQLAVVAGVGEDLLVAGQGGVEHDLADGGADRAEGLAAEGAAVLQDEQGLRRSAHSSSSSQASPVSWPSRTVKRPRRMVLTTLPYSLRPAKGVLRLRECSAAGSTSQVASGSNSTR